MKSNKISNYLILVLFFITYSLSTNAQTKKIGIVFDANTEIIHQYVGTTIFENSEKPLSLDVDIEKYIKDRLVDYLTPEYAVEICELPASLKNIKLGLLESDVSKKVKQWADTKKNEYDIVIFIKNMSTTYGSNNNVPAQASGVYTKIRHVYLYSTITYYAYDTNTSKIKGYNNKGRDFLSQLKGIKFPKNQKKQDPQLLPFFAYEFKKYLSERIEYFLSKSKLMSTEEVSAKADLIYTDESVPRPNIKVVGNPYQDDIY